MKNMYLWCSLLATLVFAWTNLSGQNLTVEGNVGIGTNNPQARFAVEKVLEIEGRVPQILFEDTEGGDQDNFRILNGGLFVNFENATTNTTMMALELPTGNVGIGTTSPTKQLHILAGDQDGINLQRITGTNLQQIRWSDEANALEAAISFDHVDENVSIFNAGADRMVIANDGNVGIGTTNPQSNLHIKQTTGGDPRRGIRFERSDNGNYWTLHTDSGNNFNFRFNNSLKAYVDDNGGNYVQVSDRKLKKNITLMDEVLPEVLQLQPKWYNYIDNEAGASRSLGFIAQEVENIFPSFIFEKEGTKALAYDYFAVLSIKAIQELNATVEEKDELIQAQNEKIEDLEARLAKIEAMLSGNKDAINTTTTTLSSATLAQNAPNPFSEATNINYFIPAGTKNASLQVMDQNGRIIKTIPIQDTGNGQITLQANLLSAGTYSYSLVLDGQVMDTKQMVLTH